MKTHYTDTSAPLFDHVLSVLDNEFDSEFEPDATNRHFLSMDDAGRCRDSLPEDEALEMMM